MKYPPRVSAPNVSSTAVFAERKAYALGEIRDALGYRSRDSLARQLALGGVQRIEINSRVVRYAGAALNAWLAARTT